jgi:cysteinyl-tRNA synthetase
MSKSLGNFYTLRDLLKCGYTGKQIRYMLLHTHYRTQLNFTFAGLDAAVAALERMSDFILRLQALCKQQKKLEKALPDQPVKRLLEKTLEQFCLHLADDLNISPALATLFNMVREVNILCDNEKIGIAEAEDILDFLKKIDDVLGVLPLTTEEEKIPQELIDALSKREKARAERNWQIADECRHLIQSQGYLIEDTPEGARLKKMRT